jgi:hypothetical protein
MCDQCNAGPFESQLALVGHKATTHAKKPVKRLKKPGVGSYAPVKAPTSVSVPPTSPVQATSTPTSESIENTAQGIENTAQGIENTAQGIAMQAASTATQPPTTAVIEPDSGAVKAAEQSKLPVAPLVQTSQPIDSLLSTTAMHAPIPNQSSQPSQPGAKEELKAVEGASLPSVKYARIAGLLAKSLNEFKLQFEASFPKEDMAKAIAAANCTIVDGKVVFTGGSTRSVDNEL